MDERDGISLPLHFLQTRTPTRKGGGTMTQQLLLAWQPLPEPAGTSYHPEDLADPETVARLFQAAARYRAHVTPQGWRFLWTHYGLKGLLRINRHASAWADDDDRDAADQLVSLARITGYDPATDRFRGQVERLETTAFVAAAN